MANESRTIDLVARLRERLVIVPKPGTEPRLLYPGEWLHSSVGGPPKKAGDSAGECQLHSFTAYANGVVNSNGPVKVQEHIYAVDPLCEEAAQEIERWRAHECPTASDIEEASLRATKEYGW